MNPLNTTITKVFIVNAEDTILGVFNTDKAARKYMNEEGLSAAFITERYAAVTSDKRAFFLDPNLPPYQVGDEKNW